MSKTTGIFRLGSTCAILIIFCAIFLMPPDSLGAGDAKNLVRIQVTDKTEADLLPRGLDIPGHKPGEWVDAVVTDAQIDDLVARGLFVQLLHKNVDELMREAAESYPTWAEFQTDLHDIVSNYPTLCIMDTIGWSYEGRPIQVVKLSDNVEIDEDEAEVLYTGLTHAREWPSLVVSMFILDSLTSAYGSDPAVTLQVNSREIYFIPCLNPDGYVYSHDLGIDWRKNRRPFPEYGTVGVDLNRNYAGSTDGHPEGEWGTTIGNITHDPSSSVYCGPSPFSEAETSVERDFIATRDFVAGLTFHTHGEMVIWSWAYGYYSAPNSDYIADLGTGIANLIAQEDYTGTYLPQQSAQLYPTTGDATDWVYGYHHYVDGADFLFYTVEIGQQFQPPTVHLAQIVRENFDGAFYMLEQAGSIRSDLTPRVIPPIVTAPDTSLTGDYTVNWTQVNPDAMPIFWQIDELTGLDVVTEGAEGSTNRWSLDGFTVSTARYHSGSKSFKSSYDDEVADALTSVHPYFVEPGDSLTFWTWYDIETDWDYGYVEVSTDGREFDILELYTGASGGWIRQAFSLEDYERESIFIRFRYTTDSYTLEEGMYVDDMYPAVFYNTINTLSSSVISLFYDITGQPQGTYYYRVKGQNTEWSWCDFSTLVKVVVLGADAGTVDGTVIDSVTSVSLDGVTVDLMTGSTVIDTDISSGGGSYQFDGVAPGTYDVRATDAYYETKIEVDVEVVATQTTTVDFDLAYNRGSIAGVVTDAVRHITITDVSIDLMQGSSTISSTTTNESGMYDFDELWPGDYWISATKAEYHSLEVPDISVEARDTSDTNFEMTPIDICGDADGSGGVDIDDVVFLINYIFAGGPAPDPYWVGDADCSGEIDIDDVVFLIQYIFAGGPEPCSGC